MGYIPYNPALYNNTALHSHHHSTSEPKMILAFWIACHALPLLVMLFSFVYNKIKGEWSWYSLPALFEFFGIWLLAVSFIDAFLLITALVMSLL